MSKRLFGNVGVIEEFGRTCRGIVIMCEHLYKILEIPLLNKTWDITLFALMTLIGSKNSVKGSVF